MGHSTDKLHEKRERGPEPIDEKRFKRHTNQMHYSEYRGLVWRPTKTNQL